MPKFCKLEIKIYRIGFFFFIEPYFNLIDMLVSLVSLKNGWQNVHFRVTHELKNYSMSKNNLEVKEINVFLPFVFHVNNVNIFTADNF